MKAYVELFMADKESAQRELVELLAKRNVLDDDSKRLELARRFLAQLFQYTAFGFVVKTVSSISSDELLEDIDSAAKAIGSPAAKMIALGARLDTPRDFPRKAMGALVEEVKTDFVAMRVAQMLTLRRLYMFRTTEQDKQWLDSQEVLGLRMQHAVDLKSRGKKLIEKN